MDRITDRPADADPVLRLLASTPRDLSGWLALASALDDAVRDRPADGERWQAALDDLCGDLHGRIAAAAGRAGVSGELHPVDSAEVDHVVGHLREVRLSQGAGAPELPGSFLGCGCPAAVWLTRPQPELRVAGQWAGVAVGAGGSRPRRWWHLVLGGVAVVVSVLGVAVAAVLAGPPWPAIALVAVGGLAAGVWGALRAPGRSGIQGAGSGVLR